MFGKTARFAERAPARRVFGTMRIEQGARRYRGVQVDEIIAAVDT